MALNTARIIACVLFASIGASASADPNDNSQSRKEIVQFNQDLQSVNGPSGLGKRPRIHSRAAVSQPPQLEGAREGLGWLTVSSMTLIVLLSAAASKSLAVYDPISGAL